MPRGFVLSCCVSTLKSSSGGVRLPLAGFLGGCHGLGIVVTAEKGYLNLKTLDNLAHHFIELFLCQWKGCLKLESNMRRTRGPRAERFGFFVMFASRLASSIGQLAVT